MQLIILEKPFSSVRNSYTSAPGWCCTGAPLLLRCCSTLPYLVYARALRIVGVVFVKDDVFKKREILTAVQVKSPVNSSSPKSSK